MRTRSLSNAARAALLTALALAVPVLPASAAGPLKGLEEQAFQRAAALAEPSIVRIETIGGLDVVGDVLTGSGPTTGVAVSEDGYIVTSSFNFVSRPASVLITFPDGRRFPADVVAGDRARMLTLLKIEHTGLTPIIAAPKADLRVGQWAIALGRTYDNSFPNVSVGIVSAVGRIWGRAVQTDAKVSPANYGGPLVDIFGRAIGILVPLSPQGDDETAGVEWYDGGIGFAIPMEDVYAVLDRLRAGEELKPGLMGINLPDAGPLAGEARIDRVRPESPADKAGLKVGDVIIEADGRPVERVPALRHILGAKYAGESVALAVRRGEDTLRVELTLVGELVPYESAFLGVLPVRPSAGDSLREVHGQADASGATPDPRAERVDDIRVDDVGVELREVLAGSPAERAGLERRDVVTAVDGAPVADAAALLDQISRRRPRDKAEVTYRRLESRLDPEPPDGGTPAQTVTVDLGGIPDSVPDELPTVAIPAHEAPAGGEEAPRTGRFADKLPGGDQEFWAYVPEQYNPGYGYALLVWLHPGGDTMEAATMRRWRTHCDRRGIILLAPKAADVSGWSPAEADFVRGVVEHVQDRYTIDPARVVVHGHADGGQFAFHLGFRHRDLYRGLAVGAAPLRTPPPDNDPQHRQQVYLFCGANDPVQSAVARTADGLRDLKFPVTFTRVPEQGEGYPDEVVDELARWIDSLDRI